MDKSKSKSKSESKSKSKLERLLSENPNFKLLSRTKLYELLKIKGITKKEIDDHFKPDELKQIYAKPKNNYKFKITGPPRSFQIDIALMPAYKKSNNDIDQFFIAVDIISRKAFAYPLKSGKMTDLLQEYELFIKDVNNISEEDEPIVMVQGDDFFNNGIFKVFNDELDIIVKTGVAKSDHFTKMGSKLGIVDRAIRTIKDLLTKYMLANDTTKWTKCLNSIVELYNGSPNRGIDNHTPDEVFDDYDYCMKLYDGQRQKNDKMSSSVQVLIGDTCRILLEKQKFQKEKAPFSKELYYVMDKIGYSYQLKGENGVILKRLYRPDEILIVHNVQDRIGKQIEKDGERHKHVTKVLKSGAVKNRKEAENAVDKPVDEIKIKRIRKPRDILDL